MAYTVTEHDFGWGNGRMSFNVPGLWRNDWPTFGAVEASYASFWAVGTTPFEQTTDHCILTFWTGVALTRTESDRGDAAFAWA